MVWIFFVLVALLVVVAIAAAVTGRITPDPMAEAAETGAKFGAFLAALGLPPDAGLAGLAPNEVE